MTNQSSERSPDTSPLSRTVTSDNVSHAADVHMASASNNSTKQHPIVVRQFKESEVPEMANQSNKSPSFVIYQPDSTPNPEETTPKEDLVPHKTIMFSASAACAGASS